MFCCLLRESSRAEPGALEEIARSCSSHVMRIDTAGDAEAEADAVIFDVRGLDRGIGAPAEIARAVAALADGAGLGQRLAIAETMTAAWLLAKGQPGVTVVAAGGQEAALSGVPLEWLATLPDFSGLQAPRARPLSGHRGGRGRASARHYRMAPGPTVARASRAYRGTGVEGDLLVTLERWGLRTLGDVARLSRADLRTRLGPTGARLHQAACGEDEAPLVPTTPARRFVERLELEWPIEGLEPLAFVLARLCEALSATLEHADRGAVHVTTRLQLVSRVAHIRTLRLPAPMREARVLRTLILLDLESHPPDAGIDVVEIEVDVALGQIAQESLFTQALPSSEDLATLLARLKALMGDTRVGAPVRVDTYDERAVAMTSFAPDPRPSAGSGRPEPVKGRNPVPRQARDALSLPKGGTLSLRRFRLPIAARVLTAHGLPVRVMPAARGLPGGGVVSSAGPWRSSGRWWTLADAAPDSHAWDRDEWDVELDGGQFYRLTRDRSTGHWHVDGAID